MVIHPSSVTVTQALGGKTCAASAGWNARAERDRNTESAGGDQERTAQGASAVNILQHDQALPTLSMAAMMPMIGAAATRYFPSIWATISASRVGLGFLASAPAAFLVSRTAVAAFRGLLGDPAFCSGCVPVNNRPSIVVTRRPAISEI